MPNSTGKIILETSESVNVNYSERQSPKSLGSELRMHYTYTDCAPLQKVPLIVVYVLAMLCSPVTALLFPTGIIEVSLQAMRLTSS